MLNVNYFALFEIFGCNAEGEKNVTTAGGCVGLFGVQWLYEALGLQ